MTKFLPIILIFILSLVPLYAQHPEVVEEESPIVEKETNIENQFSNSDNYVPLNRHFMLTLGYSQVSPLSKFKDNTTSVFHGVSFAMNWFLDRQNVAVGFVWNFHTYDQNSGQNSYESDYVYGFDQILTNIKFITNDGFLQPYIEGFVGINWLYVGEYSHLGSFFKDAIEEELEVDYENDSYSIDDAAAFTYGLGAGILLPFDFPNPNGPGVYLELGVRYSFSNEITYLGNSYDYYYHKSKTNNFTFSASFVFIL